MATLGPGSEEVVLEEGPCAVGYLRASSAFCRRVRFDEPSFVFARGGSRIKISPAPPASTTGSILLASAEVGVLARGQPADIASESSASELFVVRPRPALIEATAETYDVPVARMLEVFDGWHRLERQRWLDEVQHRYFFERIACKKSNNVATAFLEMELVKEVYFVVAQTAKERGCIPPFEDNDDLGHRAVRHVEAHLFETLPLDALARDLGTSRATLVRHFRAATGRAPAEYVRERRLDEALAILSRTSASVAEVALTVGYENVGAFTQAFRRKFGRNPSRA
jgi:AraC-like DNA-binding protein